MPLNYLIFEASDDGEGQGSWEAMASVRAEQRQHARAEVDEVMLAAERAAPGPRGSVDEGGCWDMALEERDEGEWTSLVLTLTGPWEWGEALVDRLSAEGS